MPLTDSKICIIFSTRLGGLDTGQNVLVCIPFVHMCAVGSSDEHDVLHHTYYITHASVTHRSQSVVRFIRALLDRPLGPENLHLYRHSADLALFRGD